MHPRQLAHQVAEHVNPEHQVGFADGAHCILAAYEGHEMPEELLTELAHTCASTHQMVKGHLLEQHMAETIGEVEPQMRSAPAMRRRM